MTVLRVVSSTVLQIPTSSDLSAYVYGKVVDMYPAQYILDGLFDGWIDLQMWAADLGRAVDYAGFDRRAPCVRREAPFAQVAAVVQEIMHCYSSFQSVECDALTGMLMNLVYMGTGLVPLSDFYIVGQGNEWMLCEPKDYLRHVGAPGQGDPRQPSVVIPRYVYGMNNCLASSSFFSICFTNKCERLISHVEREIATPTASPQLRAEVASVLPSDLVDDPRELPSSLPELYGDDEAPLYGRSFAQ